MEITYSFSIWCIFNHVFSSVSYLDGKSKVIALFLHTKVWNFPQTQKVFFSFSLLEIYYTSEAESFFWGL